MEYDIVAPYYKCNMTGCAWRVIGLAQLKRYPENAVFVVVRFLEV